MGKTDDQNLSFVEEISLNTALEFIKIHSIVEERVLGTHPIAFALISSDKLIAVAVFANPLPTFQKNYTRELVYLAIDSEVEYLGVLTELICHFIATGPDDIFAAEELSSTHEGGTLGGRTNSLKKWNSSLAEPEGGLLHLSNNEHRGFRLLPRKKKASRGKPNRR